MRILVVCHRLPFPPTRGGKIRSFNIIRHLSQRHRVTVASLARSEEEARAGEGLAEHCARVLVETVSFPAAVARMVGRLPTPSPSSVGYFHSPVLARRIRDEVEVAGFDLIIVHCAFVAHYVARITSAPKILDFGDMDSQKWLAYAQARRFPLSLGYAIEGRKLRREEARLARHFDLCTCTTQAELQTLEGFDVGVPLGWFPNGVDMEYFTPGPEPYDPDCISFVGRMDYFPNQQGVLDFCANVLPLVRQRRPATRLAIVGADPSPGIRRLSELPGVTVTGSVPDIRPHFQRSALTVAPLQIARGTQNKILEAMAMGVPTVASAVAAGGVNAEPGQHFLTASTPTEFANAILRVLDHPDERRRLAEAGRQRVLSHHSWASSMQTLDLLIEQCLAARAPAATPTNRERKTDIR